MRPEVALFTQQAFHRYFLHLMRSHIPLTQRIENIPSNRHFPEVLLCNKQVHLLTVPKYARFGMRPTEAYIARRTCPECSVYKISIAKD